MAQRDKIEYVRYYTSGTAARKLEPEQPRRARRPAPVPKEKRIPIAFDPVAVFGILLALVMVLCVTVGFTQHNQMNEDIARMVQQISSLKSHNYPLQT